MTGLSSRLAILSANPWSLMRANLDRKIHGDRDDRDGAGHVGSPIQGLKIGTPVSWKSFTLRVTSVRPW